MSNSTTNSRFQMVNSATIGVIAALIVATPRYLQTHFQDINWFSPILLLGAGAIAMILQRFVLNRQTGDRYYTGLTDLMVQIHFGGDRNARTKWVVRGLISFIITILGGPAGSEGAATEWTLVLQLQLRDQASKWFEQTRRMNVSCSLAGAIGAAFGAPLTAVVFPTELGVGGRTILSVISALFGFITIRVLTREFDLSSFDLQGMTFVFHPLSFSEWGRVLLTGGVCGILGALSTRFIRYTQESLSHFFQTSSWMRILASAIIMVVIFLINPVSHQPSWELLELVLWGKFSTNGLALLLGSGLLSLAVMIAGFGTIGILWPLFALGGTLGFLMNQSLFATSGLGFSSLAALAGASAFWSAVLGTPVAGAVLAYELTQNLQVLLPCLVAGAVAKWICTVVRTQTLLHYDLEFRGVSFIRGRSKEVLDSILVKDAMVVDYETVQENEPVSELSSNFSKSRYPVLVVVNPQGVLRGLVTPEMLRMEPMRDKRIKSGSPLSVLVEAKDVLVRSDFVFQPIKINDRLSDVISHLDGVPFLPVIGDDGRLVGLLISYHVRLAYEREVARRTFQFMRESSG